MKGINALRYSLKQGLKSLRKNRMFSLASIGTVAACLFLFGLFYFAIGNFRHIIDEAENSVGVSVFFEKGVNKTAIKSIGEAIESRPEVEHVEYVSAEDAWESFKQENFKDEPDLIESFGDDNPLADSASYEVYLKSIEDQDTLVEYLKTVVGVREVKRSAEVAKTLSSVSSFVGVASSVLILVLFFVSIFLIQSTIATGIEVRRPEIAIMRLMGASDYFIWSPFIVEGVIIGLVGSFVPLVVLGIVYDRIVVYMANRFSLFTGSLSFLSVGQVLGFLIPVSLILGVGIGLVGSFITVRRNLNI